MQAEDLGRARGPSMTHGSAGGRRGYGGARSPRGRRRYESSAAAGLGGEFGVDFEVEGGARREDDGAFQDVLQLADVAGPSISDQASHGLRADAFDAPAGAAGELVDQEPDEERDVLGAVAERGERDGEDAEAIVEVFAEASSRATALSRSRLVAAMIRTSTWIGALPPTRSNSRSWRTRSSLAWVSRGSSPISSRKSVPPSASSKRPMRRAMAPVKAPFSWPNSSLSTSPAGRAAQLTLISGLAVRRLWEWIARAISSLPVPVSPLISTVASVGGHPADLVEHRQQRRGSADDLLEVVDRLELFLEVEVLLLEAGRARPRRARGR